jgi:secernin
VETSGRSWVASRVAAGTRAISNEFTTRTVWDRSSADLVERAVANGWWEGGRSEPFDVARAYADPATPLQVSHLRLRRSQSLLEAADPQIGVGTFKHILRDHYEDTFLGGPSFHAARPDFLSLCMHAHPAGFTWGNTAASAIFVMPSRDGELPFLWWTPVTPCTGIYIPIFVAAEAVPAGVDAPERALSPAERAAPASYDDRSYWWHFQRLLEATIGPGDGGRFTSRQQEVRADFDALEAQFSSMLPGIHQKAAGLFADGRAGEGRELLHEFSSRCARQALDAADRLRSRFEAADGR